MRMASRISGNAICASAKRMITCSVAPPRNPAITPATLPIRHENSIELTPTQDGQTRPIDQPRQQIPPVIIRAQQVTRRCMGGPEPRLQPGQQILLIRVPRRDHRRQDRPQHRDGDDTAAQRDLEPAAKQPAPQLRRIRGSINICSTSTTRLASAMVIAMKNTEASTTGTSRWKMLLTSRRPTPGQA